MKSTSCFFVLLAQSMYDPSHAQSQRVTEVFFQDAEVGKVYENDVDLNSEFHYLYYLPVDEFPLTSARLSAEVSANYDDLDHPVRVSLFSDTSQMHFQIPSEVSGGIFWSAQRTLCINGPRQDVLRATVVVATSSQIPVTFKVLLAPVANFSSQVNEEATVTDVTLYAPDFRFVNLTGAEEEALLQVRYTLHSSTFP